MMSKNMLKKCFNEWMKTTLDLLQRPKELELPQV